VKVLLSRLLGKLTQRYTPSRVYMSFEGDRSSCSYRVMWESRSELFVVRGPRSREEGQLIRFTSPDEFCVPMAKGGYEYFERVHGDT
jgi:hypothetical protein